jgi:hypothetical protein
VETATNLLIGIRKDWDSMTQDHQVKFSCLFYRNQHTLLQQRLQRALLLYNSEKNTLEQAQLVAQTMWDSLDLNSLHGPKLEALVRKGGDVCVEEEAKASYYENFLEKFPE